MAHQSFATTTRGLQRHIPPMRLYEKAKRLGIWNPSEFDFTQDRLDWQGFTQPERDMLLRLTGMFQAGEEAVTLDLLPLIQVITQEGRIEEVMYDPMPFGLLEEDFVNYAMDQFTKRFERLEKARGASLEEVYRLTSRTIEDSES